MNALSHCSFFSLSVQRWVASTIFLWHRLLILCCCSSFSWGVFPLFSTSSLSILIMLFSLKNSPSYSEQMFIYHRVQCPSQAECWGCHFWNISSSRQASTGHAGMQGNAPSSKQGDEPKLEIISYTEEGKPSKARNTLANLSLTHHLRNNLCKWVSFLKISDPESFPLCRLLLTQTQQTE